MARKVSFGSITDNGARTRSTLTSVVTTLRKRKTDVADQIKKALDRLAQNMDQNPYNLFSLSQTLKKPDLDHHHKGRYAWLCECLIQKQWISQPRELNYYV